MLTPPQLIKYSTSGCRSLGSSVVDLADSVWCGPRPIKMGCRLHSLTTIHRDRAICYTWVIRGVNLVTPC